MKLEAKNKIIEGISYLKDNFSTENINMSIDCIWEAIRIIKGDGLTKTYYLNCPDSDDEYSGVKIALDNTINMYIGDDLGMIAYLLPHSYLRSNPYKLTTSNYNIVDVEGFILTAKKEGTVTITVTTMDDKYSDSITVNVLKKQEFTINNDEVYIINNNDFNFIENDYSYKSSLNNTNQWNCLLRYCNNNNIKKIIFPENKKYYFEVQRPLTLKNNLEIDLNKSELIVSPNHYKKYTFLEILEQAFKVNILDGGYIDTDGVHYKISRNNSINTGKTWTDENNNIKTIYIDWFSQCSYNIPSIDYVYLNGDIVVKETKEENDIFEKYIVKGEKYKIDLQFSKYKTLDRELTDYTSNTIKLVAEQYLEGIKKSEKIIYSYNWNPTNHTKTTISSELIINEECDKIKFRLEGLSDANYDTIIILGEPILYKIENNQKSQVENICFKNGSIKGDGYVFDSEGNDVKDNIMLECYGVGWRDVKINENTIEASDTIDIFGGENIIFKNCYIGESPGFNVTIGNCIGLKDYYPNANTLEYGNISDENGNDTVSEDFIRSPLIDVHEGLRLSNQIMITDPTHVSPWYYGYQSRLINVYFYDSEENFIDCQLYKIRHGIITIPTNTYYIRLTVPLMTFANEKLNNTGMSDYGNCIFNIKFTKKNRIEFNNCEIAKNYSCGIAHGGNGVIIDNCNFHDNIGRMPWCDIDSEDGWEKMQNNIFKNTIFNSYYGIILCAGINYVFKNNTFKSFTGYDKEQNIKWYNNTFISGGFAPEFNCQGDCYFINNTIEGVNFSTSICESNRKCSVNFYNNNINGGRISLKGNNSKNNYTGNITALSQIEGITDNFNDSINKDVTEILYSYTPINNCYYSKVNYVGSKNLTFNNCIIKKYPNIYYGGKNYTHTFNNCTIYNGKESNYLIFNDCTFVNKVVDSNIEPGMTKEGLTTAIPLASGKYYSLQNEKYLNLFNEPFTLTAKVKKINNWNCNILTSTDFIIGTNNNSKIILTLKGSIEGSSKNYTYNSVGFDSSKTELIYQFIYDKNNVKIYIDDSLLQTISIDSGFIPNNTNTILNIDPSQCEIENFYLYNKVLTEEEIIQNYNALK